MICKRCNTEKENDEFRKWKRICRKCEAKYSLEYYRQRKDDPVFIKRHNELEKDRRRKPNGCKYALYNRAKSRAKKYNLEFDITLDDIVLPKICPILGIPLFVCQIMSDNSPSLDRINPTGGYTKENIQVISSKANTIKSNATLEEIEKVYMFMKKYNATNG